MEHMKQTYVLDLKGTQSLQVIARPEEMAMLMVVLKASEVLNKEPEIVSQKPVEAWIIVKHLEYKPGRGHHTVFSGEDHINDVLRTLLEFERKNVPYSIHNAVGIEQLELTPVTLRPKEGGE